MSSKLLLADDSVTIQRVIELTFADEDVQVTAVSNGQQAIDRLLSEKPDIVLADVGMPERDGYEVAAFIKGDPRFSAIPVLLLTGAFEPVDEARARAVGCDGVLVKPFEPQMVISRVKELLAGEHNPAAPAPERIGLKGAPASPDRSDAAAIVEATRTERPKPQALEDYFDRLDAAFASVATGAPRPAPIEVAREGGKHADENTSARKASAPVTEISRWDPDLDAQGARPGPVPVKTSPREPASAPEPPPATPAPNAAPAATAPTPPPPQAAPTVGAPAAASPPAAASAALPAAPAGAAPAGIASASLTEAFAALLSAERGQPVSPVAPAQAAISEETIDEIARRVLARMGTDDMRRAVLDAAERLVREEIDRIKAGK
jgi:CheY-like chemotaxis protein